LALTRLAMTRPLIRSGNFDVIRLIAAASVIFGHSFIVVSGERSFEGLAGVGNTIAVSAVEVFFIVSGYLVTQSFERSNSSLSFILARSLRIFPGLIACVLFSGFVIGLTLTALPLSGYFASPVLAGFIIRNSLLDAYSFPFLPGVAFHSGNGGSIINGSLWSLAFEFACYGIVLAFGLLRRLEGRTACALVILTLSALTFNILTGVALFVSYFAAGMCMYFLRKGHRLNGRLACLAALAILAGNYILLLPPAFFPLLGGYLIIYVALDAPLHIRNVTRFGDISYGMYLYGWPMEEIAVRILGGEPPWWQVSALALPMAALFAWLSWHGVERPMLRLKDAQLLDWWPRLRAVTFLAYAAVASVFGIGIIFVSGCVLPTVLALAGTAMITWAFDWWITGNRRAAQPMQTPPNAQLGNISVRDSR
jgi:peptidoglycan/LPS O-acetylase OafA/YrhL